MSTAISPAAARSSSLFPSRGFKPVVIELKKARIPLFIVLLLVSFVLIVLPVLVLLYTSFVPYSMVPSARAFSMMNLEHWKTVLKDPISLLSLKNSLFLGIVGATLGTVLSLFVAYVIVKVKSKAAGVLESLSFLSFSFPGIVIGIGFMWFFIRTPLYGTIWALLIGYIATYLPYGIRPLTSAFVTDSQPLGGVIGSVRSFLVDHHATHRGSIVGSWYCFRLGFDGDDVPA